MHGFFLTYKPNALSTSLGTGFHEFTTAFGIEGLALVTEQRLECLALFARQPGNGQLRIFIVQAKKHFTQIYVWAVWNPILEAAMERYGFTRVTQTDEQGRSLHGWRWMQL